MPAAARSQVYWSCFWRQVSATACHFPAKASAPGSAAASRAADLVDALHAEPAWHDGHGDRQPARHAGDELGDEGAGVLAFGSAEHEDADVGVLVHDLEHLLRGLALADVEFRGDPGERAQLLGEVGEAALGGLARLGTHDVGDAHPVLELLGTDDIEHGDAAARLLCPPCGKAHRLRAFGGLVDHDEEFAQDRPP